MYNYFKVLECYVKLGDWNSVLHWCQRVNDIKEYHNGVNGLCLKVDMNYVK